MGKKKNNLKCDSGYGLSGNIAKYTYLKELKKENRKRYLQKLENEDKEKFDEFIELVDELGLKI